jgi:hypothetical protein
MTSITVVMVSFILNRVPRVRQYLSESFRLLIIKTPVEDGSGRWIGAVTSGDGPDRMSGRGAEISVPRAAASEDAVGAVRSAVG